MRHIEENRKARVIKEFLGGLSFDEIAKQVGVSHGSVVNIINEFRDGTLPLTQGVSGYIDELRRLVVDLKKHGTTVPQLKAYVKIHAKLRDMGVDISRVELWLDICEKVACHEAFSSEIVESALELELVKKDGIRVPVESAARLLTKNAQPQGFLTVLRDITQQVLHKKHLKSYIAEIMRVQEEERKRIARELHDETTQSLATLCLDIQAIARAKDKVLSKDTLERLEELWAKTNSILDGIHRFSHQLRPDVLDRLGLIPSLELLTSEFKKEEINVQLEVHGRERRLGGEAELTLFRIVQEALSNIRKHSQATEAMVEVQFMSKKVKLSVTDNGRGFKMPDMLSDLVTVGKLGLISMQERVLLLGGVFSITSKVGKGTKLELEVSA